MLEPYDDLLAQAKKASLNAHAPYSNFPVGSALEATNGTLFSGCNVENLSFPAGVCAEHNAICKAVSEIGPTFRIKRILVYTDTQELTTPCGVCRQVINEFGTEETEIICVSNSNKVLRLSLAELIPHATKIKHLESSDG